MRKLLSVSYPNIAEEFVDIDGDACYTRSPVQELTLLPVNPTDCRLVIDRGVRRVDAEVQVVRVSFVDNTAPDQRRARRKLSLIRLGLVSGFHALLFNFVYWICPLNIPWAFQDASSIMFVVFPCVGLVLLPYLSILWAHYRPRIGSVDDSEPVVYYSPHVVSCVLAECNNSALVESLLPNLRSKILRLGAIPLPDTMALAIIQGSQLAVESYLRSGSFFGQTTPAAAQLGWEPLQL